MRVIYQERIDEKCHTQIRGEGDMLGREYMCQRWIRRKKG